MYCRSALVSAGIAALHCRATRNIRLYSAKTSLPDIRVSQSWQNHLEDSLLVPHIGASEVAITSMLSINLQGYTAARVFVVRSPATAKQ